MNSRPLPYQGSALPLSYASRTTPLSYRDRSLPITTRNAKNASSTNVSVLYFPGSIVNHTERASNPTTVSATIMRPLPAGLRSTTLLNTELEVNGAQGRIRTSVTRRVADLQSAAINRSATCALALSILCNPSNRTDHSCRHKPERVCGALQPQGQSSSTIPLSHCLQY